MLQRFQRIRETDMKKLILITGILLSTSLWADMDKQCFINETVDMVNADKYQKFILENCQRNNILMVTEITGLASAFFEAEYCRFDRNVNKTLNKVRSNNNKYSNWYYFNCVLYSNEPREDVRD